MSNPYAARRGELQAEIVAQVAAGRPVRSVCAQPGMPCDTTLRNWRRADEAFAGQMAEALRKGAWRRRWMFDPARAEAFLARYRTGERMDAILRDPAMPSREVLDYWRLNQGHFAEEVHRLKAMHEPNRLRGLRRVKTPRPWDPKAADRVLVRLVRGERLCAFRAGDPDTPGRGVIKRWRRERPDFDAEVRAAMRIGWRRDGTARRRAASRKAAVVARISGGASLHSLGRSPGMPSCATLYRWVREQPDFAEAVARACEHREDGYRDRMAMILEANPLMTRREMRRRLAPLSRQLGRLKRRPGGKRQG